MGGDVLVDLAKKVFGAEDDFVYYHLECQCRVTTPGVEVCIVSQFDLGASYEVHSQFGLTFEGEATT